ncbi:MAG: M56 family metallopeptidase [Candidatus Korobacteraceae bacterium]
MTELAGWFSPATMRMLAWALLHFLWQGMVLAAIFAGLMAAFRSAAARYALAVSILILMVAAPIATFLFLRQSSSVPLATAAPIVISTAQEASRTLQTSSMQTASGEGFSSDTFVWLVRVWIAGVIFLSLRTAGGLLIVERLQHRKAAPLAARLLQTCLDLQRRIGIKRAIRFRQCNGLDVPAVIGWFRPVVLLPMTVLTGLSQAQLEAVIVHELAHIKRWDYFVNLFQIAAETLLFYHPAVWWVSRRIRLERENCCDDAAVTLCGNVVDYARALTFMEGGRTAPSLAMAASGSPLAKRVMRLLGTRKSGSRILSTGLAIAAVCLAAGVYLSQGFLRVAHADTSAVSAPAVDVQVRIAPRIAAVPKLAARPFSDKLTILPAVRPVIRIAQIAAVAATAAVTPVTEAAPPTPATQATSDDQSASQGSYIDSMKAVGLDHLSVDDLLAMKIQGVTADYVRQLHDLGLKPDADDLVAMRIQGVTPQYVREMQASGIKASADDLVAMKIQGVTPEYLHSLHDLGLKPDADDLVAMRIQQVTPEYIRDIRALGLNPSADDLVAMQIQGVTPAYIKALSAAGVAKANVDDYVAAKIQGITPEFIDKARQHGFHDLNLDQLIELKHAGVL